MRAQSRRELHGRAEEVSVAFDRLTAGDAYAYLHRLARVLRKVMGQLSVDLRRAAHRIRGGDERGHDPISQMLHFAVWISSSTIAALSPSRWVIAVEPTMSVNRIVLSPDPVGRFARAADH